jgi:thymidylate kinase
MVKAINDLMAEKRTNQQGGMIVELIGPAGVGKSTLYQALNNKRYPWLLCYHHPRVWRISSAPFYIKNILLLLPTLVRILGNGDRQLTRREIAFMAILHGWYKILRKKTTNSNNILVLDEGPISIMAYLNVWGPQSLFNSNMQGWWENIYSKWMQSIDMVVMMDASEEIIRWRINNRPQDHHLKGESTYVMDDWLNKYRILYDQIVSRLATNNHGIRVIRIDSGINSVDEIVNKVLHEFGWEVNKID